MIRMGDGGLCHRSLEDEAAVTLRPRVSEETSERSAPRTVGVEAAEEGVVARGLLPVAGGHGGDHQRVEPGAQRAGERAERLPDEPRAGARVEPLTDGERLRPQRTAPGAEARERVAER